MTRTRLLRHLAALATGLAVASAAPHAQTPPPATPAMPGPEAEPPVSMIADRIDVDRETGTVTASGNVEAHYRGRVLRAERLVYSEAENRITATGLVLTDPDVGLVLADAAEITPDFAEGLIRGARLLIAGEMQLAAAEVRRTEGRFTTLFRTVASSCEVCPGDAAPTWALRAERVIRDEQDLQIHLRNATLELFGLPVLWLPYMRMPDPAVERASGFLAPTFRRSQIYGAGVRLPYYQVLGPSADLTFTPFLTERAGALMEGEYRRRFVRGGLELSGVLAPRDRLGDRSARGAFFATGDYDLGRGFVAELDVALTSDEDFLQQFDYSEDDRLTSTARVVRSRTRDYFALGAVGFQSLRPMEDRAQVPFIVPEFTYRRLWHDPAIGRFGLDLDTLGVLRDGGRDVLRAGGGGDWRRDWIVGPGVLAAATASAQLDLYQVQDDPVAGSHSARRLAPTVAGELRWPLVRTTARATHVLEPVAQLAWSDTLGDEDVPNEDSQLPEFDETNLFALDRFPGRDRIETGLRANLGLGYSRLDPAGWSMHLAFGRVVRFGDRDQFPAGTGLAGAASDWVGSVELAFGWGLSALNRARFGSDLDLHRNEFGLLYAGPRLAASATYIFLAADDTNPDLGPQPEANEIALDARYRFLPNWRVSGSWRYDVANDNTLRAGAGLAYGNECAEFDLTVSRRFTAAGNVPPATSIGFAVRLVGLGAAGTEEWPRRVCSPSLAAVAQR